jgi:pantetheine-phosphate adenylyltransferase
LKKYNQVALGGTFDIIHRGHLELLKESFKVGHFVVIGVTSDEFVRSVLKKKIKNHYYIRVQNIKKTIEKEIGSNSYQITRLVDHFGPLMTSNKIDCLVVSEESEEKGKTINALRIKLGLPIIDIISVKMILANDGLPISSSRIRSNEIDINGSKIMDK